MYTYTKNLSLPYKVQKFLWLGVDDHLCNKRVIYFIKVKSWVEVETIYK